MHLSVSIRQYLNKVFPMRWKFALEWQVSSHLRLGCNALKMTSEPEIYNSAVTITFKKNINTDHYFEYQYNE